MRRIVTRELLDEDVGSPAEVAKSLAELRQVNRLFGGVATTRHLMKKVCLGRSLTDISVLDVGSGSGDTVITVAEEFESIGIQIRATLLDRKASHFPPDPRKNIHLVAKVVGDAQSLPFQNASFDIVSCSLLMHHLEPEQITRFAREALRVARHAVLINDLVRSSIHLVLVRIGLSVASRMSRYDGIASVRRAYTPTEVESMLRGVGSRLDISRHYLYRMGVIIWK